MQCKRIAKRKRYKYAISDVAMCQFVLYYVLQLDMQKLQILFSSQISF